MDINHRQQQLPVGEAEAALPREQQQQQPDDIQRAEQILLDHLTVQSPQADPSMVVLPQEREWALDIKRAVNDADYLDPLTDFDYVQYAIITQGTVPDALVRIEGLQACKREYNIENSVAQGLEHLQWVMEVFPGFLLHLDHCPETSEPILVWDASQFNPKFIVSACPTKGPDYYWRQYLVASYYMLYACQPTFTSIREGLMLIIDCAEVEWRNVSMDFEHRMHDELRAFYPLKYKQVLAYNTALVANLGWSLFKKVMPSMQESLKLGCKIIGPDADSTIETPTRLHQLFLQPTKESAQFNILMRARDLLAARGENARTFKF